MNGNYQRLVLRSAAFYWRTHVAVAFATGTTVAVVAGALLVGSSIRDSLAAIAAGRLGRAEVVVSAERPFADNKHPGAPVLALAGGVKHEKSGLRASGVPIYGVDARFFAFHRVTAQPPDAATVLLSPDLANELHPTTGDTLLVRVARLTDIPLDSLHGRKDDAGRVMRLRYGGVLSPESMGEFSLAPHQGTVRAAFVALSRLQQDLGMQGRVNTILMGGSNPPLVFDADDYGVRFHVDGSSSTVVVESAAGLIPDAIASAIAKVAASKSLKVTPVLTWLATRITVGDRSVPYSLVSAVDVFNNDTKSSPDSPEIVLNDWTARDLHAAEGEPVELEYYRWTDDNRLVTERASFRVAGVVPMHGLAGDRRLAPEYPGITDAESLAGWDPPFPIDLSRIRPNDEEYWRRFRTTPKAFVPLAAGQRLWRTRHGSLTSIRVRAKSGDVQAIANALRVDVARAIDPASASITVLNVAKMTASASAGVTDFSVYFAAFSAFLMLSSLLLTGLFFRLGVEQRLTEIGALRAMGFSLGAIRRVFLGEGVLVASAGCALGVLLAVGWAALMMHGLRTWWVDAVGTSRLTLHVHPDALVAGVVAGFLAGALAIAAAIRGLQSVSPRSLLTGGRHLTLSMPTAKTRWLTTGFLAAAIATSAATAAGWIPQAGGFFGAGSLVLATGLAAFRWWLGRDATAATTRLQLGVRNASWRPGRSLASAGLVAAAVFLIVSVDAFRKNPTAGRSDSGTGGYELIAESSVPIVQDISTIVASALRGVDVVGLRLRPGDDASCLNLYRPKRPRVLGVPDRFIDAARFRFSASIAATGADRQNPWRLLRAPSAEGIVPAIADATSLEYVLHASVGDVITIDEDTSRPLRLRIVAALRDSMLQGELAVAERTFLTMFPDTTGYRVLLIDTGDSSSAQVDRVAAELEEQLGGFDVDVQDSDRRLASFHRVENTYLSTFQALGGLGLLLGSFGLAAVIARNVLERRRELALLAATGYTGRDLQLVVFGEQLTLVASGLIIGIVAAAVAIGPILISRAAGVPRLPLAWLGIVVMAALGSTLWTTRSVGRLRLIESLRTD